MDGAMPSTISTDRTVKVRVPRLARPPSSAISVGKVQTKQESKKSSVSIRPNASPGGIPPRVSATISEAHKFFSPGRHEALIRGWSTATGTTHGNASPAEGNVEIVVKKTGKLYDDPSDIPTYKTHSKSRGEVLIVNNIMFTDQNEIQGAVRDHENLESLFTQMGFKVTWIKNLSASEMKSEVERFSKRDSLASADIAVVIVMSQGTKNETVGGTEVFGSDDEEVLVDELIKCFNQIDCKQMVNKPKIFIFLCCRGHNQEFVGTDATRVDPPRVPALTDALVAYSSLHRLTPSKNASFGAYYILKICEVFSEHAHQDHVEDLLKLVNVDISNIAKNVEHTTYYENMGFKRCYLHPV